MFPPVADHCSMTLSHCLDHCKTVMSYYSDKSGPELDFCMLKTYIITPS